jgi:hypothetical protein
MKIVEDLRGKDEDKYKDIGPKDKDKDLRLKDKDKDLEIGPQGSSRTRTLLEDNNTANKSQRSSPQSLLFAV